METTVPAAKERNYNKAAWFYEEVSNLYSTGRIRKAKAAQVPLMEPGQRVLYLGVGTGEDAVLAAQKGVQVTCVDLSSSMIKRVRQKMDTAGVSAECIVGDATKHCRWEHYDVVATNFFLNCFREPMMRSMLGHATRLIKPGGRLMIADVALAQGNWLSKAFNIGYLKMGMLSFWMLGLVPLHRNYDYESYFGDLEITKTEHQFFRFAKIGPVLFQNIVGQKKA